MPDANIILPAEATHFAHCAELLRNGEVVALPTETVYGLAANALDTQALRKIFEVKGRPLIDPLIVHCKDLDSAKALVIPNTALDTLAEAFWPGPLTIVLPKQDCVPDIVTAGKSSVAIRVPAHPVFRAILERVDFPLAAPSANPFGYVSPTLALHVQTTLGERIPAILDGGPANFGLESTIIDLRDPTSPAILRHGPVTHTQLETCLGTPIRDLTQLQSTNDEAQVAPGSLTQHYSPRTKLVLFPTGSGPSAGQTHAEAWLFCQKPSDHAADNDIYWLSEKGDLDEIAHNLFKMIQQLDAMDYTCIHVETPPMTGIGHAINDRLRRAAAKFSS